METSASIPPKGMCTSSLASDENVALRPFSRCCDTTALLELAIVASRLLAIVFFVCLVPLFVLFDFEGALAATVLAAAVHGFFAPHALAAWMFTFTAEPFFGAG